MRRLIILITPLLLCCSKCGLVDEIDGFIIKNNSGHQVAYYIADNRSDGYVYPDTILPVNNHNVRFTDPRSTSFYWEIRTPLEEFFKKNLPVDTLSVFVFHLDTLTKYSWDEVRDGYMILKRYDLSLENIRYFSDRTITYPPMEAMRNIKQYPPYGQ